MKIRCFAKKMLLIAVIPVFCLAGCGQSERQKLPIQQVNKKFTTATVLTGQIAGKDGVITTGLIKVTDNNGRLLLTQLLRGDSHYRLEIPAGTAVPIIMGYFPDANSPEPELLSVAIEPSITRYDLNPLTTAIAKTAQALGGYSRANMVMAAEQQGKAPDANRTTAGFRGDTTKQYGGWH